MASEEAELVGGISVSLGASDAKLISDLEAAERLVQERWSGRVFNATLSAQARGGGAPTGGGYMLPYGGGGGGTAPISQQQMNAMMMMAARSPMFAVSARRAAAIAREAEPRVSLIGGGGGRTGRGQFDLGDLPMDMQNQVRAAMAGIEDAAAATTQSVGRTPRQGQAVEVPAANIDTSALATQLNQIVATFSSFNERLATAFVAMPSAGRPEAGQAPAPVPSPRAARTRATRAVATAAAVTPVQAAEETADEGAEAPRPIRYSRRGAPVLDILPGEDLGSTNVSPVTQSLNRYGVRPIRIIGSARGRNAGMGVPVRSSRQEQQRATRDRIRAEALAEKEANQRSLIELSYEAQRDQASASGQASAGLAGRQRTPAEQAEYRRAEAERANALASRPATVRVARPAPPPPPPPDAIERERLRALAALEDRGTGRRGLGAAGGVTARQSDEEIERRQALRIQQQEATRLTQARTGRTFASGLGGLSPLGLSRQQIEINAGIAASTEKVAVARRRLEDPAIIKSPRAYRQATEELTTALKEQADWTERLNKLNSGGSAARSLAAVTIAGAAFGIGLSAISVAFKAVEAAAAPAIDQMTGFGATSTRITSALAAQTLAAHGNVEAVLAQTEAQAGLSKQAADTLNAQLRLTTQVKAGALAQQQASELTRAGVGTDQQTPQGLFGGFGGLGGSALFAQQMGGGKGFTEQISADINALARPPGKNPLEDLQTGISYVTNDAVKSSVNAAAKQQGNALPDVLGYVGRVLPPTAVFNAVNDLAGGKNPLEEMGRQFQTSTGETLPPTPQTAAEQEAAANRASLLSGYLEDLGAAAERGAPFVAKATKVTYEFAKSAEEQAKGARAAAAAGDAYGFALATQSRIIVKANGQVVQSAQEYKQAVEQTAVGRGRTDPATLAAQFNVADQAMVRALGRTREFALQTQLPAQAGLQALAQPLLPVGTGIPGGAGTPGQQKAIDLQKELNAYYQQGQQEIINTYKPEIVRQWGAAAGAAFQSQIDGITQLGKQIAYLQADIANVSVEQTTKQYNYQLFIARRTLTDIAGLTGHDFNVGQSHLGVLEKQNLALSRQGQQLQFMLSQRQINFQQALAGFQAPGVTPEERQARIKEAQIEAGFAQKQLDIQRQMFGNQVQIVDISNLRQGHDLAKQINLLISGRQAAIRIAVDQQELINAQKRSEQLVKQAGAYLSDVDTIASTGISHIQEMEVAAGRALTRVELKAVKLFSNFVRDITTAMNGMMPTINAQGGVGNEPYGPPTDRTPHASGAIFQTRGPTMVGPGDVAGEAGRETVAILRNVRPYQGSSGGAVTVNFNGGIVVRQESDIDEIARKVEKAMGRKASQIGLRSVG